MTTNEVAYTLMSAKPIETDEWEDVVYTVNQHGGLKVTHNADDLSQFVVSILAEDGSVEMTESVRVSAVEQRIFKRAIFNGWIEETEHGGAKEVIAIQLEQFDPFSLGYCFQLAAFGKEIVS